MKSNFNPKLALLAIAVSSCMALTACGGGGGDSKSGNANTVNPAKPTDSTTNTNLPTAPSDVPMLTGRLIDSAIEGVHYKTASGHTGITDKNGEFQYQKAGEKIEFFLGNQTIGQASATSEVHIFDIKSKDFLLSDEQKKVNDRLVQIMQLLDTDNNPENGITINEKYKKRLLVEMNIDFANSDSLYTTLSMKDDTYFANTIKTFVNNVQSLWDKDKKYISQSQAVAHANKNRKCTSIDDFDYITDSRFINGINGTTKLNSNDRSCHQKAELLAFFYHVKQDMWRSRDWYNQFLDSTSEVELQKDIKATIENNVVANLVDSVVKYTKDAQDILKDATVKPNKPVTEILALAGASSAELVGNLVKTVDLTTCVGKTTEQCELEKNVYQQVVIPNIISVISNTVECRSALKGNSTSYDKTIEKCIGVVQKIIDSSEGLDWTDEQIAAVAKKSVEGILLILKTGSGFNDLWQEGVDRVKVVSFFANMIDDAVKFHTNYNIRTTEDTANMSGWLRALEVVTEGFKVAATCPNGIIESAGVDCFNEVVQYSNKRVAEVLNVAFAFWHSSQGRHEYENQLIAESFLAEYLRLAEDGRDTLYHLTGDNQRFFKTYANVNDYDSLTDAKKSQARRTAMLNIAKKLNVKYRWFGLRQSISNADFVKIDSDISQAGRYTASVANKILSGEFAYVFNTRLGDIVAPQAKLVNHYTDSMLSVPINQPISFTADYKAQKGLVRFEIAVLKDGKQVFNTLSDVPLFQHTFANDGWHTVSITPIIESRKNFIRKATVLTKNLPIFVIGDMKISRITYGNGVDAIKEIAPGKDFLVAVYGKYLPLQTPLSIQGCINQRNARMSLDEHIYKCTLPSTVTGNSYDINVMGFNQKIQVLSPSITPSHTPTKLPATGITLCGNADKNNIACQLLTTDWKGLRQDGEVRAGQPMSYTILNRNNAECVQDKVTGLIWEQKTDDGTLRDKDNRYTWYNPDNRNNRGNAGLYNNGKNTLTYIEQLNASNYCGYNDWRLPSQDELLSIVDYGRYSPAIDPMFVNTQTGYYWSSSPSANSTNHAWGVSFYYGNDGGYHKDYGNYVRAVRSE